MESFKCPHHLPTLHYMPGYCSLTSGLPGEGLEGFIQDFITSAARDPWTTWFILPTEALVTEVPEKKKPAAATPPGGGYDDMY
jgi:hypothetical protein